MQMIAGLLLVAMTLIYIVSSVFDRGSLVIGGIKAFSEAGMVGACADWFAVVALFRHPLGLPIPHTGVIPANKNRIGGALGRFVTSNFLTPRMAAERMAQVDVPGLIADWLNEPIHIDLISHYAKQQLPKLFKVLMSPELGDFLGKVVEQGAAALPAAPLASKALSIFWANGEAQMLFDQAIDLAEAALVQNREVIAQKVSEKSSKYIPKWVDNYIANKIVEGLISTFNDMRNPDHAWRMGLKNYIEQLIDDLASDPQMFERGEQIKRDLMQSDVFKQQMAVIWSEIYDVRSADGLISHVDLIASIIETGLQRFSTWLTEDPARTKILNRRVRLITLRLLLPLRFEIADYIAKAVDRWDDATLVEKLELQVGKDLQYIRINGTLVGGFVGLIIFLIATLAKPILSINAGG